LRTESDVLAGMSLNLDAMATVSNIYRVST